VGAQVLDGTEEAQIQLLSRLRESANLDIEKRRNAKEIGGSLDAALTIAAPDADSRASLERFGDELRFFFITSDVTIANGATGDFAVSAERTDAAKCVRCWHHRADVGAHAEHPELCGRCVENVDGAGETRRWF
jgi:isoleucyl-tRNA synthetase